MREHPIHDAAIKVIAPRPRGIVTGGADGTHHDPKVEHASTARCQECGSTQERRLCVTCGHVGCCESQLAHGTHHWEDTGHPVTTPTPASTWYWCDECDGYVTA